MTAASPSPQVGPVGRGKVPWEEVRAGPVGRRKEVKAGPVGRREEVKAGPEGIRKVPWEEGKR